jgi:hypothetical protein
MTWKRRPPKSPHVSRLDTIPGAFLAPWVDLTGICPVQGTLLRTPGVLGKLVFYH